MPRTNRLLSPKEERFVAEYLACLNATEAYIRAGYKANRVTAAKQGWALLRKPRIAKAVEAAQAKALKKADLTLDKIVKEMARIAMADIGHMLNVDADGNKVLAISKLGKLRGGQVAALRLKKEALVALGQHLGGFGSKLEVGGPGGGPLLVSHFASLEELPKDERDALRAILTRRLEQRGAGSKGSG